MATTTPDFFSSYNPDAQALYTIEKDQFNKTIYTSVGNTANVSFPVTVTSSGSTIDIVNGVISLTADQTYLITARCDLINAGAQRSTPTITLYNATGDETIGAPVPVGGTLNAIITPGEATTVNIVLTAPTDTTWAYPAQVINASITVDVIGGYTV